MNNVTLVEHPVVSHWIAILRQKTTKPADFRRAMANVTRYIFMEAAKQLPLTSKKIQTPLTETTGDFLDTQVVLVPILRAGQGMVDPILDQAPNARVGYLGMYRDEERFEPVSYYFRLPEIHHDAHVFVIDPMLATGGSASLALSHVKEKSGATRIQFLCIISAPEGVQRLQQNHPDVHIFTSALDTGLNERKFIVPGLGDAGDRQYNTLD